MGHLLAPVDVAWLQGQRGLRAVKANDGAVGGIRIETETLEAAVAAEQEIELLARADAVQGILVIAGGVHHLLQVAHAQTLGIEDIGEGLPGFHPHHLPVIDGGHRCLDQGGLGQGQRQQRVRHGGGRRAHRVCPRRHDEAGQQGDQQRRTGKHPVLAMPADRLDIARAIERPVCATLVEATMKTLCLAAYGLLARLQRAHVLFGHAVFTPYRPSKNSAYHNGDVQRASMPLPSMVCDPFLINAQLTSVARGEWLRPLCFVSTGSSSMLHPARNP